MNELSKIIKPNIERAILALCMKKQEVVLDLQNKGITTEMFLIEANRIIYNAICYLFSKGQAFTPLIVLEVLKNPAEKNIVEEFGGVEYLTLLQEQNIMENNVDILVDKLKQAYTRYKLIKICNDSEIFLTSDETEVLNPHEIISKIQSEIQELTVGVEKITDIYKIGDDTERIIETRAENPESIPGLEVGWDKLDYYTNGGQPGDLIMLCARAKTGKSATLTNWATKLSITNKEPVLYIDTEMNSRQQEDRILSMLTNIPHKEIVAGTYVIDNENGKAKDKLNKIKNAIAILKESSYYHVYMPNFTVERVTALARKFKLQHNISALFFDYLKMPSSQLGMLKSAQEWQILGYLTSNLKDLAGELNIPIWSACQENRTYLTDGKKNEKNVGGSDRILQFASKLLFLSNKTEEEIMKEGIINGNQTLYIAYQRNGESDCPPINIMFDKTKLTQKEV